MFKNNFIGNNHFMTREEIESLLKYASPKTAKKLTKMLIELDNKENKPN